MKLISKAALLDFAKFLSHSGIELSVVAAWDSKRGCVTSYVDIITPDLERIRLSEKVTGTSIVEAVLKLEKDND